MRQPTQQRRRHRHPARPEHPAQHLGIEHGLGRDVERPTHVAHDRHPVRLADVQGVHSLEHELGVRRHQWDELTAHQTPRHQRPEEQPGDPRPCFALEDQRLAQAHDPHIGVLGLEAVEQALHRRLVPRVVARRDPLRRPAFRHRAVLRPRRVGADRRGVDDCAHTGPSRRREDPVAAHHVGREQRRLVVRGLDEPGQVHDHVGAAEQRHQVRLRHVRRGPFDLGERQPRQSAGDTQHRVDPGVGDQRGQHARSHVPGRTGDDDSHTAQHYPSARGLHRAESRVAPRP